MAIASSRTSASLRRFVDAMGLAQWISMVVGGEDVTHAKPHAEPVLKILQSLEVAPADTLVVGDMAVDIMMGKAAGTRTCAVSYGNSPREQLAASRPDFIIDSFSDLLALI